MPSTSVRDIELILPGSFGKETLSNDGMQNLALGISGAGTIALASTDHTLTTSNDGEAMRFVQILTGTLTANVNVLVPAESRVYIADNRTTGAFTVTFRTAAGSGIAVDQGARTLVYCDGANVYPVASGTGGGGGGSGAPTDASYLVGAGHSLLTGERVVTDTATVTWDLATAGQAKALIPPDAVTYSHLQNVTPTRLLGRFTAGVGDVQEITPGSGLSLDSSGVLTATAVGQPLDATLTALAGLATGANQLSYATGTDVFAQTPLTPFARTLLDDADQAAMQATLGVVPGTTVQPLDATLTALAGVTTGADRLAFFTGTDLASTTVLTAFMRGLLDDPDLATAQATLGITGGGGYTDEQAQDAVGAMLVDTATIDLTYTDATPSLTAALIAGSVTATHLADGTVTYAKLQPVTDNRLLGRSAGSAGVAQEITTGTGLTLAGGVLSASGGGSSDFLGLTDTPNSYTGQAGKGVTVNGAATGLEFSTAVTGSYDLGVTWAGTLPASQVLMRYPFPRAVDFPAGLTGSRGVAAIAATGTTTLDLRKNGASIGSVQYAAGATTATFTLTAATSFAAGDVLTVHAPGTADATLADLGLSLAGTRAVAAGEMGATTWLGLTDTPNAYTGQGGNLVAVNPGATALDYKALPLAIADGGTGATTAATARTNLGLGSMAQQDATNVVISGGAATFTGDLATTANAYVTGTSQLYGGVGLGTAPVAGQALHVGGQPSVFDGSVGIGAVPAHAFHVNGVAFVSAGIGLGTAPVGGNALTTGGLPSQFGAGVGINRAPGAGEMLSVNGVTTLGGMVGIQTTTLAPPDLVRIRHRKADQHALSIQPSDNDTGGGISLLFQNVAGTPVGSITTTGAATSFNTSSDRRLKTAIEGLSDALTTVQQLLPVRFRWQTDGSPGVGFVADEVQQVVPEAVTGQPDGPQMQGVDFSKLVPYLVRAVQTLAQRLEALEARETPG